MAFVIKEEEMDGGFGKIPPGIYNVVCSANTNTKIAKSSGKEYMYIELDILSAKNGDVTLRGSKLNANIYQNERMGKNLGFALRGFGLPFPVGGIVDPTKFIGLKATVEVKHNGEFVNVNFLKSEVESTMKATDPSFVSQDEPGDDGIPF